MARKYTYTIAGGIGASIGVVLYMVLLYKFTALVAAIALAAMIVFLLFIVVAIATYIGERRV